MANRLAQESSPYLLQHKDNPVDWNPWGEDALQRAREEDKPILLSIGYSACHWCHVMEHESFEDAETARFMNENFVPIKVDREERPDVDALYMEAVQSMSGHGGWPLTAFLDPEGIPFYGGTYYPPEPRQGMPSFRQVMEAVLDAYRNRREELRAASGRIREGLAAVGRIEPSSEALSPDLLEQAEAALLANADSRYGGFGGAPKFPPASALEFLLARGSTEHVELTLDAMAAGGMYDHLGGGFARYAVDSTWLVPHFEKMLYDNALLARAYLHGWRALGHQRYRRICTETLDFLLAELRGPEGGFYSALDADSEGEEGRYYVWEAEELRDILGDRASEVISWFGVTGQGNFEGRNILHLPAGLDADPPQGIEETKQMLLEHRRNRVRPGLDDKRLTAWNALAIGALAEAGAVPARPAYLDAARRAAEFVLGELRDSNGHLLRTWKDGQGRFNAYLEDHAFLVEALLTLYEATFEARWFEAARDTADTMVARFADEERGGFFITSEDHEQLIARRKDLGDHPIPAGNSSAAFGLLRLGKLSGERDYEQRAVGVFRLFARAAVRHADGFGHLLTALDFHLSPVREVALVSAGDHAGTSLQALARVVRGRHRPHLVLAGGPEGTSVPELLRDRVAVKGSAAAYVCQNFTCERPVTEPDELAAALDPG